MDRQTKKAACIKACDLLNDYDQTCYDLQKMSDHKQDLVHIILRHCLDNKQDQIFYDCIKLDIAKLKRNLGFKFTD